jgi:hypothetical protein
MKRLLEEICKKTLGCLVAWLIAQGLPSLALAATAPGSDALPASVRVQSLGVTCPSTAQVETVLRDVLGSGENATSEWVLSYGRHPAAPAAGQESSIWMELLGPTGQRVAWRQFPRDSGDCAAIASAMAVVVERSLHALGWPRGEPLPEAGPPKQQEPVPTPPARSPPPPRLILGAGPAVGSSSQFGGNLLVEARVRVAGPLSLCLGGSVLAGQENQTVGSGKAQVNSRHLTAAALSTFARDRVHLDTGLLLLVSIDQGKTQDLLEVANGTRESLAAGLLLGMGVRLSSRWRIALDVAGLRQVAGADFVVNLDGTRTVVLPPPTWQGVACAKLEFVMWP